MADPKERPILFSGPMVRAILAGQKTVTRRVAKDFSGSALAHANAAIRCPYGAPGDRLWVRETWQAMEIDGVKLCAYRASCPNDTFDFDGPQGIRGIEVKRWRPGIHMPRTFSRLSLDVVDVRVERLHTIDDADAEREGFIDPDAEDIEGPCRPLRPRLRFAELWDKINGKRAPWASNPWVWRVAFERVTP